MKTDAVGAWGKKLRVLFDKYKFVLLIILVGIVLLLLPTTGKSKPSAPITSSAGIMQTELFDVEAVEQKLEHTLSQVDGAGEVSVMLTLKSSARQILAQDGKTTEKEGTMDATVNTVVVSKGSGTEETVALQQLSPQYQGALVVCSGGDNPSVRLRLTEAVSALTGLGTDKISICKGK